jgi:nucleoside-diphosphate-sugar epimerase
MRVFVAGATGVLGRRAVRALAVAGHDVTALVRSPAKAAIARSLGATPVEASLFEPDQLRAVIAGHDAVCNLATHIPPLARAADRRSWDENSRIRSEGSHNLVDAALATGATCYVQESIAFLYGDHGDELIDASTTPIVDSSPTGPVRAAEAQAARFAASGGRGVVLRFGGLVASDSDQTLTILRAARRGLAIEPGRAESWFPSIAADDAATAVVAALAAPSGTYDVVDDEPMRRRDSRSVLAAAVGRKRLHALPSMKRVVGPLADSQRVSNRRFRDTTGWAPGVAGLRDGWPATADAAGLEPALRAKVRLLLWLLALGNLGVGIQAALTPRSFYNDFPFGRGWVAMDGPYNEHLVRDVGTLNLALVVLVFAALVIGTRPIVRTAMIVWLVNAVPHLVYHLRHLVMIMPGVDKFAIVATLGFAAVAPVVVLMWTRSRPPAPTVRPPAPTVSEPAPTVRT